MRRLELASVLNELAWELRTRALRENVSDPELNTLWQSDAAEVLLLREFVLDNRSEEADGFLQDMDTVLRDEVIEQINLGSAEVEATC